MRERQEICVRLVGPEVWKKQIESAFDDSEHLRRCARAILEMLHNRHVGITPLLVADLVRALLERGRSPEGVWASVLTRLTRELAPADNMQREERAHQERQPFGLMLNATPVFVILRVAVPVVQEACRRIRRCYLFSADGRGAGVSEQQYEVYEKELSDEIEAMTALRDGDGIRKPALHLFWQELALTLHSLSRPYRTRSQTHSALPEADPIGLALLMDLEPEVPQANDALDKCAVSLFPCSGSRAGVPGRAASSAFTSRVVWRKSTTCC